MSSRYGSHELAVGAGESVITSVEVAGFDPPGSVITGAEVAGFGGDPPRPRTGMPAARRYSLAVSRRTPVSRWIRRSVQPSRPSASIWCRLSSLKTFAIPSADHRGPTTLSTSRRTTFSGRFSGDHQWPVLGD